MMRYLTILIFGLVAATASAQKYIEVGHPNNQSKLVWSNNLSIVEAISSVPNRMDGDGVIMLLRQNTVYLLSQKLEKTDLAKMYLERTDKLYLIESLLDRSEFDQKYPNLIPVKIDTFADYQKSAIQSNKAMDSPIQTETVSESTTTEEEIKIGTTTSTFIQEEHSGNAFSAETKTLSQDSQEAKYNVFAPWLIGGILITVIVLLVVKLRRKQ